MLFGLRVKLDRVLGTGRRRGSVEEESMDFCCIRVGVGRVVT